MGDQKRPVAVSVIGWAWILFGAFAASGSAFVIVMLAAITGLRLESATLPIVSVAVVELVLGSVGVVAGVSFLMLAPWSRPTLETLTWLMLAALAAALAYLFVGDPPGDGLAELIGAAVLTALLYGVPLALMVYGLRSEKVRLAMGAPAQQARQPDARKLD